MASEPPTSAIFRALRSVDVDPELAHEAGQNVIAFVGAQISELRSEMKAGRVCRSSFFRALTSKGTASHGAKNQRQDSVCRALGDRRSDCLLHDLFRLPAPSAKVATTTHQIAERVRPRRIQYSLKRSAKLVTEGVSINGCAIWQVSRFEGLDVEDSSNLGFIL